MSLGPPSRIEPLRCGTNVLAAEQTWRLMVAIVIGGLASYLGVKYLRSESVISRGPLVIGHVAAAALAIGIGFWQFLPALRSRWPRWHHWVGRIYIAASLFAGSIAVFRAANTANLDPGGLGLAVTALLWIAATTAGLWAICGRSFASHRRWMMRSYALALTQLTLRFYARGINDLGILEPATVYPILVWAALISNLIFAEWIARALPEAIFEVHLRASSPSMQGGHRHSGTLIPLSDAAIKDGSNRL